MKSCILTTYNFQVEQLIIDKHLEVMRKLTQDTDLVYFPLRYNLPNRYISHSETLDYGISILMEEGYDNFLILDVDCIPLSTESLLYTFDKIKQDVLIGNVQRSMHIENNKHVYIGSSCIGFSKNVFDRLGRPSFAPTVRGDTAEELTYLAEEHNIELEMFRPIHYERDPLNGPAWELETSDSKYGVGTTFANKDNLSMFYHLFESRVHVHNHLFYKKCNDVLYSMSSVELFNPFGCYMLRHQIPQSTFDQINNEVEFVRQNLNDESFVSLYDMSKSLAGQNCYQIRMRDSFLKQSKLEAYILNLGQLYLQNKNLKSNNLSLGNVWINYAYKGNFNPIHNHDSLLSGVIYIKQDGSDVSLNANSRTGPTSQGMTNFAYSLNNHPLNNFTYSNSFENRQILMFPSWLTHWVNPFLNEGERITIAFNILGDL